MRRLEWWIVGLILLGGFIVRLYRFDNPIADWHSWRQADTAAVSRNFVEYGFDILHPTYEDISNIASGHDNPQGYRFVEFPIYNVLQAALDKYVGILLLREWGRLITIFSSLSISLVLYLIVKKYVGKTAGLFTAFYYTFIPYSIYYGRTILPDTSMAAASLAGIYCFDKYLATFDLKKTKVRHRWLLFSLSIFFTTLALLLKPYAIFFVLPIVVLVWQRFGLAFLKRWQFWFYFIVSILPLLLWRYWIMKYPQGIPASTWLLNGNGIRFRPAFFRWLGYERFTKLISGYFGVLLVAFAFFKMRNIKKYAFFYSFLASSIIYICVIATGNVQHDYYQILVMPSLAIFYGLGAYFLYTHSDKPFHFNIYKIILVLITVLTLVFGWYFVKDYFDIDNPSIIAAGHAVDILVPKNALVIAPYNGDTSLLYQTKRQGWPSFEHDPKTLIKMGAQYLVLPNPQPHDFAVFKQYNLIANTKEYAIWKL